MANRTTFFLAALAISALPLAGCGDDGGGDDPGGGTDAAAFYEGQASQELGASTNQARCSTCHSDDGTQAGYAGNTFKDIAYHESYKGGMADLRGAINACVTGWMGGEELSETDEGYLQLKKYMESISSKTATAANELAPEVLADEAAYEEAYGGGDAAAGEAKFTESCATCHAASLVVGKSTAPAKASLAGYSIGRIAQKVRTSGPPPSGMSDATDSTPGPMPFFEPKDLSAQDLKDIIAYVKGG